MGGIASCRATRSAARTRRTSGLEEAHFSSMASFQDLAADNPNLRQQYDEWRAQRVQNGEDSTDYEAFRQHVSALGAPDPGEQEIDDSVGDDFKATHRKR